mgnify:CR=1 FL=1
MDLFIVALISLKAVCFEEMYRNILKIIARNMNLIFETYEVTDMFGNKKKVSDIKVVITDKSLKWLKFTDMMGGTKQKSISYISKINE